MAHDCMVYAECADTATVSCGTSHVTTKQHCKYITGAYLKCTIKSNSHSFRLACSMIAESLPKFVEKQSTTCGTIEHTLVRFVQHAPHVMCTLSENKGKVLLYLTQESKMLYHSQMSRPLQTCITDAVIALSAVQLL